MVSLLYLFSFLGFFFLYRTSKRADLNTASRIATWAWKNPALCKKTGAAFVLFSFILAIYYFGFGAGLFYELIILMTLASLVVCIAPIRIMEHWVVALFFVITLGIEIIIR